MLPAVDGCRRLTPLLFSSRCLTASLFACQLRRNCRVVSVISVPSSISTITILLITLVEGGGVDWLQAGSPCLQVSARCSTAVPRQRTQMTSSFGVCWLTPKLDVVCVPPRHRHWLSTVCGNGAFPVAVPRVWNSLPQHVTSAPSLAIFRSRLKTHLFRRCFPWLYRSLVVPKKWHVITDTLIVFVTYLLSSLPRRRRRRVLVVIIIIIIIIRHEHQLDN